MRVYGSVTAVHRECQLPSVQACRVKHTSPGISVRTCTCTKARSHTHTDAQHPFKNNQRGLTVVSHRFFQLAIPHVHAHTKTHRTAQRPSCMHVPENERQHKLHLKR